MAARLKISGLAGELAAEFAGTMILILFGVGVVAQCVEEQDILLRLKADGVGYVQGFGVYQPHPIDALAG